MASEYLQREEAAKKQLGKKGVKKRVKQLPTAARAFTREMTGIDISRKGVSVDPIGLAMAVSPFKLLKASKALRAAGQVGKAAAVEARAGAKLAGKSAAGDIAAAGGKSYLNSPRGKFSIVGAGVPTKTFEGATLRSASRSVFPNAPKKGSLGSLEFLPGMTKTQAAAKMLNTKAKAAYRAKIEGTRVTELEKRLNLPGRAPKRGR